MSLGNHHLRAGTASLALAVPFFLAATTAFADVTISSAATQDMSCSDGVCSPTAADAVLNVGDLETLLASGNVTVTTTGSGVQADNIDVTAAFAWSSTSTLALDAYESISVGQSVSVTGAGGLALTTNDGGSGGTLWFGASGSASFASLSSQLTINGAAYTLVGDIATLASDVAANPGGDFALAANYDASGDGTYSNSPVTTTLSGTFEGLGNTISNMAIKNNEAKGTSIGLFSEIAASGTVANLGLASVAISVKKGGYAAGLVGANYGLLFGDHVGGHISGHGALLGGLVEGNNGTIDNSYTSADVVGNACSGGLVGFNDGMTSESYATGSVTGAGSGGLVCGNYGTISNSYAIGSATGRGKDEEVGGAIGYNQGSVTDSYSTRVVTGGGGSSFIGGFVGESVGNSYDECYWDTTTSKTGDGTGNDGNVTGITGLTTKQLKSGLPAGFDSTIWAEKKGINGGLPYLIANPPVK